MNEQTRRTVMKRGAQAVGGGAVLTIVPFPVEPTDTALFDLMRGWQLALKIKQERREAWSGAVDEYLPPEYRQCGYREIPRPIRNAMFTAPHVKALSALCDEVEAELAAIRERIAETPALTIGGIAAKLNIAALRPIGTNGPRNRPVDLVLSALADAERLAGRAS